tara:strand:- start:627 stop:866 length:240 start_codon:yes stop_codon:yes gene_type:complete
MADIPFRVIDLIMKFAGAYSQDKRKAVYLDDIKLIRKPMSVREACRLIRMIKYREEINWIQLGQMIWGNTLGKYHNIIF